MKIVVVGLGYVGLSNAVLLAQHNDVIGVDISQERVSALNARKSTIVDAELSQYMMKKDLNLSASLNLHTAVIGADYVIVSTPTNYDEKNDFFDTSSVESVILQVIESEPKACIVVKSTIPIGFIDDVRERFKTEAVIFSPEFLREGKALYDNLYPSRIIVGEKSERAEVFANLLAQGALKKDIDRLLTGTREAEAIKLFSNTYLAMRVAYFNELDSFALANEMNSHEIISGVSHDPRIGNHYNNPSFGYGGYCLPKDTKQLLANYNSVPQKIISAVIESNSLRQEYLVKQIMSQQPKVIGVYRMVMKADSDNCREASVYYLIQRLAKKNIKIIVYEPYLKLKHYKEFDVENNFNQFIGKCDLILANRISSEIENSGKAIFSRDIFGCN